ncbi:WbqC-like protein family protein [Algoriphagus ornithinivorans]|uniref:WbqC-like protein family protein n=1 Tax=Algoriphagus ornithinivorans TaxID=226506 RepID=A0A1I5IK60_9BACT|nr:WbqC family protein [Algoriphagus ornithinivorans]SFO60814.1 WbqC-like protein family protein [Algoriphagus ornithinivorans]
MRQIIADLFYLPNLEFFSAISQCETLYISPFDTYQRKSYFNRTQILLSNKVETLSIPIVGRRPRLPLGEIQIDYNQKWLAAHLRGIQSAYGKAPFFEFFFPYIESIYEQEIPSLWDLNYKFLTICLKLLQLSVKVQVLEKAEEVPDAWDIRGQIKPSEHFSNRNYYQAEPYTQLFGLDFEPNLSVLDLLLCEGPTAKNFLLKSAKKQ